MMHTKFTELYEMAEKCLTKDTLPFWYKYSVDEENGGFYGRVSWEGLPEKEADKGLILNARLLWTFSEYYRMSGKEEALDMAKRAYAYLDRFMDEKNGGCFLMLDYTGQPADRRKATYANAFSVYALSSYAVAVGDDAARDKALSVFRFLEEHAFLPETCGYVEILSEEGVYDESCHLWDVNRIESACFTMNTHLHLLEAYTGLVRAVRTDETEAALRKLISIMLTKVYDAETCHQKTFFTVNWKPVTDDVSYGHDIEAAWLMTEAAEVLGDETLIEAAKKASVDMAKACIYEGQLKDGSMINEFRPADNTVDTRREWWVEAETVVGSLNAYEISGDESFLQAAVNTFYFIDTFQIDHVYGEWISNVGDCGRVLGDDRTKVNAWKAPYHGGRMCMEVMRRYREAADK